MNVYVCMYCELTRRPDISKMYVHICSTEGIASHKEELARNEVGEVTSWSEYDVS
jgi:hypothetical protein